MFLFEKIAGNKWIIPWDPTGKPQVLLDLFHNLQKEIQNKFPGKANGRKAQNWLNKQMHDYEKQYGVYTLPNGTTVNTQAFGSLGVRDMSPTLGNNSALQGLVFNNPKTRDEFAHNYTQRMNAYKRTKHTESDAPKSLKDYAPAAALGATGLVGTGAVALAASRKPSTPMMMPYQQTPMYYGMYGTPMQYGMDYYH